MKNRNYNLYIVAALLFPCLLACKPDAYEIDPPSYIAIDSFTVSNACFDSEPGRLPIISHDITDAWIFIDGHLQGTYELPVKFPVIDDGAHEIEIRPGIKKNGIAATRAIYPFYEFYKGTFQLTRDASLKLEPCVAYRPTGKLSGQVKVGWQEDFEGVVDIQYNDASDTTVTVISGPEVFEGNFSGGIFLTENDNFFEMISPTLTTLPINGNPIYLEINYRTNHDFFVGLYAQDLSKQENLYGFRAKKDWNKVYIELSEAIRYNGNSSNFNIFIGFIKRDGIPNVNMYIDNIKLLYF